MKSRNKALIFLSTMMILALPVNIYASNKTTSINTILTSEVSTGSDLDVAEKMELVVGMKEKLTYTCSSKDVTFKSSDKSIAKVDKKGNVTAVAKGTATITVTCGDYDLDCEVTVYDSPQISVPETLSVVVGESQAIDLNVLSNDDNNNVSYMISDNSVVSIDSKEMTITGLKEGTTKVVFSIAYDGGYNQAAMNVTVDKVGKVKASNISVVKGETKALPVTTNTNQTIQYTSSDKSIAKVDKNGNVTGVKAGSATITVKIGYVESEATVTVKKSATAKVPETFSILKGDKRNLGVTTASTKEITYSTSDPSILTVNSNGTIKAKENGTATITVQLGKKTYTSEITVSDQETLDIPETYEVVLNEDKAFKYTTNCGDTPIFTSSDEQIFTVDKDGTIHALKTGSATLTVTVDNLKKSCKVNVVKDISLTCEEMEVVVGESKQLAYTTNSTTKATFKCNYPEIATINSKGVITGKKEGSVNIEITIGNVTKKCKVTIVNDITLKVPSTLSIGTGEKKQLEVTTNSTNTITYKSSDEKIVKVSKKGVITAISEGKATITVSIGDKTVKCKVTVTEATPEIEILDHDGVSLYVGSSGNLHASTKNQGNLKIKWTSSDESIISVDDTGKLTCKKAGTVTITATLGDSSSSISVISKEKK